MKRWTRLFVALSVVAMPVSTGIMWWTFMTPVAAIYTDLYGNCGSDWGRDKGETREACDQKWIKAQQHESLEQLKSAAILSTILIALAWGIGAAVLWTYRWIMRGEC